MTVHHQSHQERIDSGLGFEWDTLPAWVTSIKHCEGSEELLRLRRQKKSHHGIELLTSLQHLWASQVNQDFLDMICRLENLTFLSLDNVTAHDLSRLSQLKKLKTLCIEHAPKIEHLSWLADLPDLEGLALQDCKHLHEITSVSRLTGLRSLALEGGTWSPMTVETLQPLASIANLSYLFLTNLKASDASLQPLKQLKQLKVLQCGNFFPAQEFQSLAATLPELRCDWFA